MNTRIRRFILRLIVGLLTFAAGVAAAMLLGGFSPFNSYASPAGHRHTDRGYYQSLTPEPAFQYPVYREHGCKAKRKFKQFDVPPPPEPPLPPSVR